MRRRTTMSAISLVSLASSAALAVTGLAVPAVGAESTASSYSNPVSAGFADTFADPSVIRGKDGYWYSYGTTDPLREGEAQRHLLPISRSTDLVNWEFIGDAFTEATVPSYADTANGAALWAPDIRYVEGEYRLYYVVTETTVTGDKTDNAIGVATAPTPAGPWTDSGAPVVPPRRGGPGDNFLWTFDPHHVTDTDGTQHLFYGSYYGGMFQTELDATGRTAVGPAKRVAIDNKYEGAYVVRHDGWWYLFASSANCCAGPTTGYSVHVGRSRTLEGPFVDRENQRMDVSRAGGTPVIAANGNAWVGTGHNALVTDLAGQDWFVYHAIDRTDPYLDGTDGINERPMLVDRLDWISGWPTVRAGAWASDGTVPGPVTGGDSVTDFTGGPGAGFTTSGTWTAAQDTDTDSGTYVGSTGAAAIRSTAPLSQRIRVEADVRQPGGGTVTLVAGEPAGGATQVTATVDADRKRLVLTSTWRGQVSGRVTTPLPAGHDASVWHSATLEVRDGVARAELTDARLYDPEASLSLKIAGWTRVTGTSGVDTGATGGQIDNLSVVPAHTPVTRAVPVPRPGRLVEQDTFSTASLRPGWTAVRNPPAKVSNGQLVWPVENADLVGAGGTASLLLRDAPEGDWTVETKVSLDLGTDTIRNYQQAGLVAYVDDDLFTRLSHVAIWNTRQTEFGIERPYEGRLLFGGTIVGPPAGTTWLRISHTTDGSGEHELRASTSRDGQTWVHGGVWTLPAGSDIKVGLISHGGQETPQPATARFDYFRVTSP